MPAIPLTALLLLSLTLVLMGDPLAGAVIVLAGAGLAALWST